MKKYLLLFILLSALCVSAQQEKKLKKVMDITITEEGGANGAMIVWHPVLKKYYCPMAGNEVFPLQIFDVKGKILSKPKQETLIDVRGMWYNSATKKMYANGYNETGWVEYAMDNEGNPTGTKILFEGLNQPGEQSVGTYDAAKNVVYFLSKNKIYTYSTATAQATGDPVVLKSSTPADTVKKEEPDSLDVFDFTDDKPLFNDNEYNNTTVIYTGIKDQEFGLLNIADNRIDLFDRATGTLKLKLILPEGVPVNRMFNFSYANGMYWLFDKKTRAWKGYK